MPSERRSDQTLVAELHEIRDRLDSLIETLEIASDKDLLADIKESLREAERGEGRPLRELIDELEGLTHE